MAIISRTESQKRVVETSDESVDMEFSSVDFRSSIRHLVHIHEASEKDDFDVENPCTEREIIKTNEHCVKLGATSSSHMLTAEHAGDDR